MLREWRKQQNYDLVLGTENKRRETPAMHGT